MATLPAVETGSEDMASKDSLGQLTVRLVDDVVHLVRTELRLARTEMQEGISQALIAVGAVAAGGMIASLALLCLLVAGIAALAKSVGIVAAALIVAAIVAVVGAILIFVGIGMLKKIELAPKRMVANLKRDVETLKGD